VWGPIKGRRLTGQTGHSERKKTLIYVQVKVSLLEDEMLKNICRYVTCEEFW
jgi:hypothetical protein